MEFSFGEQMKMLLKRKDMTIQDLADLYTEKMGVQMSRQNLTQRLKRDNFPEQDMRIFAGLLGYQISIELTPATSTPEFVKPVKKVTKKAATPEVLPVIEEIPVMEEIPIIEEAAAENTDSISGGNSTTEEIPIVEEIRIKKESESNTSLFKKGASSSQKQGSSITFHIPDFFRKNREKTSSQAATVEVKESEEKQEAYATNTVRKHPTLNGYLQVYERETNTWSDVKEDEFWKFQEKKKQMLGKDYQPPIIL